MTCTPVQLGFHFRLLPTQNESTQLMIFGGQLPRSGTQDECKRADGCGYFTTLLKTAQSDQCHRSPSIETLDREKAQNMADNT